MILWNFFIVQDFNSNLLYSEKGKFKIPFSVKLVIQIVSKLKRYASFVDFKLKFSILEVSNLIKNIHSLTFPLSIYETLIDLNIKLLIFKNKQKLKLFNFKRLSKLKITLSILYSTNLNNLNLKIIVEDFFFFGIRKET